MVRDVAEATGDEVWLAQAVDALEGEYRFWMTNRMTPLGLNQYGCNAMDEKTLLGYYEYVSTRLPLPQDISIAEKMRIAKNFVAEAESGEDYTPRYASHNALDYVQIDLNSHLYGLENFLCEYFTGKDEQKAAYYRAQAERRVELIERYCFNEDTGAYCDYDFVSEKKNEIICCACFLPYYYGFARKGTGVAFVYEALKTKGGVAACQDTGEYIYQWGYPYIWAPYQYFAYKALVRYGYTAQAAELRERYMRLLSDTFDRTGALWERYDENGNAADLEYPTQPMLGWTAGVYNYFYEVRENRESK
jgi:alpha,alpha-trehalase